jgi:hypothetical protein
MATDRAIPIALTCRRKESCPKIMGAQLRAPGETDRAEKPCLLRKDARAASRPICPGALQRRSGKLVHEDA